MFFLCQLPFFICWWTILFEFLNHLLKINNLQILTSCFCQLNNCYWYSCQFNCLFGVCCKRNFDLFVPIFLCFKVLLFGEKFFCWLFLVFRLYYLLFYLVVIVHNKSWQCCYLLTHICIHEFIFLFDPHVKNIFIFILCWVVLSVYGSLQYVYQYSLGTRWIWRSKANLLALYHQLILSGITLLNLIYKSLVAYTNIQLLLYVYPVLCWILFYWCLVYCHFVNFINILRYI